MSRSGFLLSVLLLLVACADENVDSTDPAIITETGETSSVPSVAEPESETVEAFFARFKSTVRANDVEAVANMASFPFELGGATREGFIADYYPWVLGEGDYRARLLAGSPGALRDEGDGRFSFTALVSDCVDADVDCGESAAVFYFGQDEEGHWRLVDMMLAG
ncbi:MAG: hypothetical protein R3284_04235 [Rubricoccaceae bacterium]|nr:hypothetical protein [Rubricoccaceae bacterium]